MEQLGQVLECVEQLVKHKLTDHNWEWPASGQVRWKNTAMWERMHMVQEGLLRAGSPRGIREITEKGRQYLRQRREALQR